MVPTFQEKDYLISEKVSYLFREPKKGEIVIVKTPDKHIIKRVIAVGGDHIKFVASTETSTGKVLVNGVELKEDYINEPMTITQDQEYTIGEGKVFVLGDNRNYSMDSRVYGAFDLKDIKGKVILEIKDDLKIY